VNLTNQQMLYRDLLNKVRDEHPIWDNELLLACTNGDLNRDDFRYIFSQYYYYSKNFTKLLAAALVKNDNDFHRAKLSANLWEESGELDIDKRHSEIFRKFLINVLDLDLEQIKVEPYTKLFFKEYLDFCLNAESYECFAMLSFGTEGIISKLYSIFKRNLIKVGFSNNDLLFFNIHIECDDKHSITLEEISLSYIHENHWFERSKVAINTILDLRDRFFKNIYESLQFQRFKHLINNVNNKHVSTFVPLSFSNNIKSISEIDNKLYSNKEVKDKVDFKVKRASFNSDILDPRIVYIAQNSTNELHNHAHETLLLFLEGSGQVVINDKQFTVKKGDLVFIPRWCDHQTRNTGEKELKIFAITDYGFTKNIPSNTESVYRKKKI
jgi:mannose-6-phosphate isomerase-like protein (cupin superfamily)/pyrroloquinoline quinone (PQQ) biosynthesis protein C